MSKLDLSDSISNLLAVAAVSLAIAPFVYGEELNLIVSGLLRDGALMVDNFGTYLGSLLS